MILDDEAVVLRRSGQIQGEVLAVLERYQRPHEDGPVFARYITLHAVVEVLGRLITEAIAADPDRARPWCRETLEHLALFVTTSDTRPQ